MHFFRSFMYLFVLVMVSGGCITSPRGLISSQPVNKDPIVIVAFGDSITLASRQAEEYKWPVHLQSLLKEAYPNREIQVINSGVGGNTSREGLARIEQDVLSHNPDIVLVEFGGNDATKDTSRHVSLEEFRANMIKITAIIQEKNFADVVYLTFPPVIDEWHSWGTDPFYSAFGGSDGYIEQYRNLTRAIAHEKGLLLIDIDKALRAEIHQSAAKNMILPDGVHLTDNGNRVLAESVAHELMRTTKIQHAISFSEHLIFDGFSYPYGIAAGDLDGDGDLDISSADCKANDSVYWFENDGEGKFTQHFIQKNDPSRLERHMLGDINGDGHLDVVIVKNLLGDLVWFENSGTPTDEKLWARHVITTDLPGAYDVALADIDHDGDLDVAASSWVLGNQFAWFENDGSPEDGEWAKHMIEDNVDETRTIRAADFDGDGDVDLLGVIAMDPIIQEDKTKLFTPGYIVWYEQFSDQGTVAFKRHQIARAIRPLHGEPADMDGDGDMDVVMAMGMSAPIERTDTHHVIWYENTGIPDQSWPSHVVAQIFHDSFEAIAHDLDQDGDMEIIATSWRTPGRVVWFDHEGDPKGDWTMHTLKSDWRSANQVIVADFNGDARPDIAAIAEHGSYELRWWRNEGPKD